MEQREREREEEKRLFETDQREGQPKSYSRKNDHRRFYPGTREGAKGVSERKLKLSPESKERKELSLTSTHVEAHEEPHFASVDRTLQRKRKEVVTSSSIFRLTGDGATSCRSAAGSPQKQPKYWILTAVIRINHWQPPFD